MENPHKFRFGDFCLDAQEEILLCGDAKVAINSRTFQVLRLLVERAGKAVSKQEFFDTVWADTFVQDNSLTVAITALRKALGDDAKNPKFIENVPRKGYRFIAEVMPVAEPAKEPASAIEPQAIEIEDPPVDAYASAAGSEAVDTFPPAVRPAGPRARRYVFWSVAGLGLLFAAVVIGGGWLRGRPQQAVNTPQINSIAVLPFESQDSELEYLADGFTDSVTNNLAISPDLRVISRNSVFKYKKERPALNEIAEALKVKAILTGRIVSRGTELIVRAELTDASTNSQIWGHTYVRPAADAITVQQQISHDIADALRIKLSPDERFAVRGTKSPDAWLAYVRGRFYWNRRANDDYRRAIEQFNLALQADPAYAMAYAGLADTYLIMGLRPDEDRSQLARSALDKAVELDPHLSEVYASIGFNECFEQLQIKSAEQNYRKAIELNPNNAQARHWLAELLVMDGRFDEGLAEYDRALALDPLSMAIKSDIGMAYYSMRDFAKAATYLASLKQVDPSYSRTYSFLSSIYLAQKDFERSINELRECYILVNANPEEMEQVQRLRHAFAEGGEHGYWREFIQQYVGDGRRSPVQAAWGYAQLGEADKAFEMIELAISDPLYRVNRGSVPYLKARPELDPLHNDPRWPVLLDRLGLSR